MQEVNPIIPAARVQRFAAGQTVICLYPPPFQTIAETGIFHYFDFWKRYGALKQVVPKKALIIGDFGLGSDTAIILDFSRHATNPPVLHLRWGTGPDGHNEWVQGARDFDELARLLGLEQS